QLGLQAELGDDPLRGDQLVRRNVDAVVVASTQIANEQVPGAQAAAADLQHPVAGLQSLANEVVKLRLSLLQPGFASLAGLAGGRGASRPRLEPLARAWVRSWARPGTGTWARAWVQPWAWAVQPWARAVRSWAGPGVQACAGSWVQARA